MAKEKIHFRVTEQGLTLADNYARSIFNARNYKLGQIVRCEVTKLADAKFNRLIHKIGQLCIENIEDFENYTDAHAVIKRLQLESNAWCDEVGISLGRHRHLIIAALARPGFRKFLELMGVSVSENTGLLMLRIPKSLSFAEIDHDNYIKVGRQICRHLAENYWIDLSPEQIEEMVQVMVDE